MCQEGPVGKELYDCHGNFVHTEDCNVVRFAGECGSKSGQTPLCKAIRMMARFLNPKGRGELDALSRFVRIT